MATRGEPLGRLSEAIQELSGRDAAEVLAEAREAARARVGSMLAEALTEAMLSHVREQLPQPRGEAAERPQPKPKSAPPAPARSDGDGLADPDPGTEPAWYVYGVVSAQEYPPTTELGDAGARQSVEDVTEGPLTAIVTRVPAQEFAETQLRAHLNDMAWVESVARGHERVLDALCKQTTVIPMRLCTVYKTEGGVREMLLRESDALREALRHLEGKTEWGVKVFFERPRASKSAPSEQGSSESGSGAAYMDHRRQERERASLLDEEVEAAVAEIHHRLESLSHERTLNPPQRPEVSDHSGQMVLNGAYLVEYENESPFHEEAHVLQSRFADIGLELVVTGPWPAYNFLPERIGTAW